MAQYFLKFAKCVCMKDIYFNLTTIGDVGKQVASLLRPDLPLLLYGQMGAGKTTLTKYIIAALGCEETVTSPTFTIMQSYQTTKHTLWHVDLYRLEGGVQQIGELGLNELNIGNIMIIEWPERLDSRMFSKHIKGDLSVEGNEVRHLVLEIIE
jgi:tRNA threonylcarbamoyladenosine biosynthesis protein TsaE